MAGKVSARRIYSLDSGADIRHRQATSSALALASPPAGPKGHGSKPASQSERRRALSDELSLVGEEDEKGDYPASQGISGCPSASGEVFTQWHCRWWMLEC